MSYTMTYDETVGMYDPRYDTYFDKIMALWEEHGLPEKLIINNRKAVYDGGPGLYYVLQEMLKRMKANPDHGVKDIVVIAMDGETWDMYHWIRKELRGVK